MKSRGFWIRLIAGGVSLFIVANCSQSNTPSQQNAVTVTPTLTSIYQNILSQNCITCHVPGGASNGAQIDFTSITTAYQTLLSDQVTGTASVSTCGSVSIVIANHPETSYLEAVLDPSYYHSNFVVSGCTPYHNHIEQGWMTSAELSAISTWISQGALNN